MTRSRHLLWLAAAVAVLLAGFSYNFAGYALLDPDEGRNAEVAREMAATNDYVLPHLNGLPYVDKPALYFAVEALAMEIFGATVFAARLPSLLFTVCTILVVAWFARRLFGSEAAWASAVATGATPFTLAYSRTVIFDSALTLWVVLALAFFYLSVEAPRNRNAATSGPNSEAVLWYRTLAWLALALGVLTKGPIALAIPLLIALPFALWRRRARVLIDPLSVLLFVAVVLPWVFAVSREVPGYLDYVLITETAARLTTTELGRTGPPWYFFVILPAAALPWSLVVASGGWVRWKARRGTPASQSDARLVFLLTWIVVPLLFFTLSQSKRPQYVLPLVPAVGLLVGAIWADVRGRLPGVRVAAIGLALLGMFFLLVRTRISGWVPANPDVARAIPVTATVLGITCCLASVVAWVGAAHRGASLLALSLPVAAVPFASGGLMRAIGDDRSAEELASAIRATSGDDTEIIGVGAFPPSLPFYLERSITLSTADGSELTSNYLARSIDMWRSTPGTTVRDATWWREAVTRCMRSRVFVVKTDDTDSMTFLAGALPLIATTRKYAAFGPCGEERLAEREPQSGGAAQRQTNHPPNVEVS